MFAVCDYGYNRSWERLREGGRRMRAVIDSGLYIVGGLISGLEAMSEMRELLDEIYGEASTEIPGEE